MSLVFACGAGLPDEANGERAFREHLTGRLRYDASRFRVSSFRKTDGIQSDVFGVKTYTLRFIGTIEWPQGANEDCIGVSLYDERWRECSTRTVERLPGEWEIFRGTAHFEKHESGWVHVRGMFKLEAIQNDDTRRQAETRAKLAAARRAESVAQGEASRKLKRLTENAKGRQPHAWNSLAWFRATTPVQSMQDSKSAVELASYAVSEDPTNWRFHGTLAAAYARAGDFDRAVQSQTQSIALLKEKMNDRNSARSSVESDLRRAEARLRLYQEKKPYTEGSGR
ncbi:MAG TPA: hypothetical protein VEK79_01265 [Thermoanaerobaculia bacterium]|nr:hypothetical protein [Thermoanaerobaculia bacterium]